ncbi:bacteriophage abortive infection AbiH family protein [Flavobacterium sp. Root420]|uniref:bacteriophage abortive infection AbiH family protein n=1 Tax=Flavobacterium sp. Root420 TaxID=1736533 RepID=UPI0006F56FD3|nr:bacteriophage abortive infection AbiH family protein [Flavobacterium sp. Root420]KQX10977.1 hypothetical protein ASC72_21140 [Flavobacterium sp. Root420]
MKTLYIIGNGFDIHHGLDTRYQSFAQYLDENNSELYNLLLTYYGLPDITDPDLTDEEYGIWSRFEQALADLDYISVLDDNSDWIANPSAEDFKDREWHQYQQQMELIIKDLTTNLVGEFNSFILKADYGSILEKALIEIDDDSHFLSFNYTSTLSQAYEIGDKRITYIHNRASEDESSLILGHGTDPANFQSEEQRPPAGLSDEELFEWEQERADQYDYSYESAKEEILSYYTKAFKNTAAIIIENSRFFSSLGDVGKVIVLGHSISEVDLKYFEEIKAKIKADAVWHVSYFAEVEKDAHKETLSLMGIDQKNIVQIKITDLLRNSH